MFVNESIPIVLAEVTWFDYVLFFLVELAVLIACAGICFAPFEELGWRPKWLALPPILPLFVFVNYCLLYRTKATLNSVVYLIMGIAIYFIIVTATMVLRRKQCAE